VEHTFDIACVDFYNKVAGSDEVEASSAEGMEEAIEFNLGLRITQLTLVPRNRAEAQGVAVSVGTILCKDPSNTADR